MLRHLLSTLLLLVLSTSLAAAPPILRTDKTKYLVYEPVYLQITSAGSKSIQGYPLVSLENEANPHFLQVTLPDGSDIIYRPPVQMQSLSLDAVAQDTVVACLIVSQSRILTSQPGTYAFSLRRRVDGQAVTNVATIEVLPASRQEDQNAVNTIGQNRLEYAWFIYMAGGEHLVDGSRICRILADGQSSYAPLARSVVAISFCTPSIDVVAGKVRRPADLDMVVRYFPGPESAATALLKQQAAAAVRRSFHRDTIPMALLSLVTAAESAH